MPFNPECFASSLGEAAALQDLEHCMQDESAGSASCSLLQASTHTLLPASVSYFTQHSQRVKLHAQQCERLSHASRCTS